MGFPKEKAVTVATTWILRPLEEESARVLGSSPPTQRGSRRHVRGGAQASRAEGGQLRLVSSPPGATLRPAPLPPADEGLPRVPQRGVRHCPLPQLPQDHWQPPVLQAPEECFLLREIFPDRPLSRMPESGEVGP